MDIQSLLNNYKPVDLGFGVPNVRQKPQGKKKNFVVDQISTIGGIAGGIGGSLIAPIAGTAAGGAIGSGLGEAIENAIMGESLGKNVAKETALGGIFAGGPIKLAKGGVALATGKGVQAASQAAMTPLRKSAGNKLLETGEKAVAKQFRLNPSQLYNFKKKTGEDAVKVLQRFGIGSADEVATKGIQPLQAAFDYIPSKIPSIETSAIHSSLKEVYEPLIRSANLSEQTLGNQIKAQADEIVAKSGTSLPAEELNKLRKSFDDFVNYTQRGTPEHNVNKMTADALRKTMQQAADRAGLGYQGKTFKEIGKDLQKLYDLHEVVTKQSNLGRGSNPIGLIDLLGAAGGGAAGGLPGMVAGGVATRAINSPATTRAIGTGSRLLGNSLVKSGSKVAAKQGTQAGMNRGIMTRVGASGVLRNDSEPESATAQSLEDALMGYSQSAGANMSQSNPMAAPTSAPSMNPVMQPQYQNQSQMSSISVPQGWDPQTYANFKASNPNIEPVAEDTMRMISAGSQNPYSRENLLADMQRDPVNAGKYIAYYQQLEEIFNPVSQQTPLKLNNTAVQTISDLQTGLDNLGGLGDRISSSSANAPVLGALRSRNPFDTEAKSLRAEIDRVKQVVGKALEGGVLRKEDEEKYARILPTINDTDAVAAQKIEAIRSDLENKLQTFYMNQQQFSGSGGLADALMQYQGAY